MLKFANVAVISEFSPTTKASTAFFIVACVYIRSRFVPFETGAYKQNNRLPASGGGQSFTVEKSLFTSALAEITSSETFVSKKAPLRLQRSVAVPHSGQLLMLV